ncbi:MAG TPA: sensor histidine kinase [Stellaceae bacterium]|jgi:signal transduction histidine kinase|nr:sensor histidine kinase [Stellaceae bacterium]
MAKISIPFEASARLQRLIGRSLVPNDEMAIIELVKNSYDSGATEVRILIQPDTLKAPGFIRVTDNGSGMSAMDIADLFMFAGFSKHTDEDGTSQRVPTGEKGIGRFAAHKLGETLDVYSAKRRHTGVHLAIDWSRFDVKGRKKFSDIAATYEETPVAHKLGPGPGTVLEIHRLHSRWDGKRGDELAASLRDLLDPFSKPVDFDLYLEIVGTKRGAHKIEAQPVTGDISMELRVDGNKALRVIRERGAKSPLIDETYDVAVELKPLKGMRGRFVYFHKRPTKSQKQGLEPGVRVYRDGFRIQPFGDPNADWLGISEERAKRAGHAHIVPGRLYGFIEISRRKNPELVDTTSRQAILQSEAKISLVNVLREGLKGLRTVLAEIKKPQWKENQEKNQNALEQARLFTLGALSMGLAHDMRQPMQSIRTGAENILERLKQLNVKDEIVNNSQGSIDRGIERLDRSVMFVSKLANGDVAASSQVDLAELLRADAAYFSNLAKAKNYTVQAEVPQSQQATVNEVAVTTIVTNYIHNACQSIETSGGTRVKITLTKRRGVHRIGVEDDGVGVPQEIQSKIFSKFVSKKTGGMGYGLSWCKTVANVYKYELDFESKPKRTIFWLEIPE